MAQNTNLAALQAEQAQAPKFGRSSPSGLWKSRALSGCYPPFLDAQQKSKKSLKKKVVGS
jgi:hypothetical protein